MLKHGFAKCGTCHTDPSGGETLGHMGRLQAERLMVMPHGGTGQTSKLLYGVSEPADVRLGGSLRFMSMYTLATENVEASFDSFPMQADVYASGDFGLIRAGASLGYADVPPNSPHLRPAQVTRGADGPQLISRWHWVGLELGKQSLLRAGRLNLPFGIRVPEHVLWARDFTKTDRESDQQHGVAFSYHGGPWRTELMFVVGNYQMSPDRYRQRGYSGFFEHLLSPRLALGASSQILQAQADRFLGRDGRTLRHAHGLSLRYSPSTSWAFLAEADLLKTTTREPGVTGFLMADYEPTQGLHFALIGELGEQGKPEQGAASGGSGEPLLGAWASINWFFYSHWDLRIDFVLRDESPERLQAQLHFYF